MRCEHMPTYAIVEVPQGTPAEAPGLFILRCNLTATAIALLEEKVKFLKEKQRIIDASHNVKVPIHYTTDEISFQFFPSLRNIEKMTRLLNMEYESLFEISITSHKKITIEGEQYRVPLDALFMGH